MSKRKSSFDSQVHVYRAMKRMTQQELADKVGCTRQTIIQLERNRYNPSLLLANNIANVFEVPIEKIFAFKEIKE
ncbi:helix-turn-helix transcriptional regulator [Enterococcus sp. BWM-S5]|uniref:Helix-turn-helix transcriptional regulator n=2 Tax=Enterococcus larvae TaxID=2794352 RepID=A0ABS4CJT6_9ENTE|nr:helix-turn-helix transcriptional regulator [Enterococcus larvae]MBP1046433.1 helix-turn-helix transcriptional regulator [Enterococcus larvae]